MRLYEIATELIRLTDIDEEIESVEDELAAYQAAFVEKTENIVGLIKSLEGEEEAIKAESQRLAKRARTTGNRIDRIKDYLEREMERLSKKNVNAGIFKVRIQSSTFKVNVEDVEQVPEEFKQIEWKVDKKSILAHFKETGEIVEGTDISRGQHLRIY